MASKSDIRKTIKVIKNEFEPMMIDFAGDVIGYKVMALDEYKNADTVFVYADYNREVKTGTIIKDALKSGKKVAMPRVYVNKASAHGDNEKYMKFHYISSDNDIEEGYNGIREPKETQPCADYDTDKAIMIMPIVAFDENRNRVGYGGGFYDKYLNSHSFGYKVGIAYDEQKVDSIDDKNQYDARPDMIITQKNIYR